MLLPLSLSRPIPLNSPGLTPLHLIRSPPLPFSPLLPGSQAEVLYAEVERAAGLRGDASECIVDLFCGAGTIALSLARR